MRKHPDVQTKLKPVSMRLPGSLVDKVKIACVRRKTTFKDAVTEALEAWLKGDNR